LLHQRNEEEYNHVLQWLKGEDIPTDVRNKYWITERLDKSTANRLIRSLTQWIRAIGYSGTVLLFDEVERGMSIQTSREKRAALDNLRQLIDECGNSRLAGTMLFYAVPDERMLLEEKLVTYEALRQRLQGIFDLVNPTGVKIHLDRIEYEPVEFLVQVGIRLSKIYELAYEIKFNQDVLEHTINTFANEAFKQRYAISDIEEYS
jgi:hypothetical protein